MIAVLKLWHKWSWLFHIGVWLVMGTSILVTYRDSVAVNTSDIAILQQQHKEERLVERMATQEESTKNIKDALGRIELVQGKIFDRINSLTDSQ